MVKEEREIEIGAGRERRKERKKGRKGLFISHMATVFMLCVVSEVVY